MRKLSKGIGLVLITAVLALAFYPGAGFAQLKNVIILISDGCGYYHIEAADHYQYGEVGTQIYETFPLIYGVSTYSASGQGYDPVAAWQDFDYVMSKYTDSAAAATAMSTGVKTYNGAVGVDTWGEPLEHLSQRAEILGKATGVVTSVMWSHATPAGFIAHNSNRNNYVQIAQEMLLDTATDLIMGCGHPWFDNDGDSLSVPNDFQYVGGEAVWNGLLEGQVAFDLNGDGSPDNWVEDADGDGDLDPWTLIQSRADFQALMSGPTPQRVLGMPQIYETLQQQRTGALMGAPYQTPLIESVPTLAEMTSAALNILDDDPDGLFLMIEGGAIDWASHGNQSGRMIEEEVSFNEALEAVIDWVQSISSWDETLVIVTADHECGYLTGPGSGPGTPPVWNPIDGKGIGELPGMEWHSTSHTNSLIPLFAQGFGGDLLDQYADEIDSVRGPYIDNTEIAQVVFELLDSVYLSLEDESMASSPAAFGLGQNYPNPFNPTTVIRYQLSAVSLVNLSVYDIAGRKVAELVNGWRNAGSHEVTFDGSNLASGVYLYHLTAGNFTASSKMVLVK